MALKALVEKLDDVAKELHGEYEEIADGDNAGKFRLKVDDAESLVDVSGLKGALAKANRKGRLVDAIRKEFPDATDEELTELVKRAKAMKGKPTDDDDPKDKDVEKEIARRVDKLKKEMDEGIDPIKKENESLKSELRRVLLDDQIRKLAIEAGVFPEDVDDVVELTRGKRLELDETKKLIVLDKDGDPSAQTPEKFFKETYKKEKPRFYKAPDAGGDGAPPSKGGGGGGGSGPDKKQPTKWSEKERSDFIEANGAQAYRALLNAELVAGATAKAT